MGLRIKMSEISVFLKTAITSLEMNRFKKMKILQNCRLMAHIFLLKLLFNCFKLLSCGDYILKAVS